MYDVNESTYTPENVFAGEFPIAKDFGAIKTGVTIHKYAPIVQGENGIEEAAAATVVNVVGIAADVSDGGKVTYYLTGEFFTDVIHLPTGVTAATLKPVCRKLGIFLKEINNKEMNNNG